jgi:hypothetical protein
MRLGEEGMERLGNITITDITLFSLNIDPKLTSDQKANQGIQSVEK